MSGNPQVVYVRPQSNTMGLAGFIVSLVGWVSCGVLCPIGLVLSLLGLRKQPRGFAVAGVVLGALGSLWAIIALFFGGIALLIGCGGALCGGAAPHIVTHVRMNQLAHDVTYFNRKYGRRPNDLDDLATHNWRGGRTWRDAWGQKLHLEIGSDGSYTITSDGPDEQSGTEDDVREFYPHPHPL